MQGDGAGLPPRRGRARLLRIMLQPRSEHGRPCTLEEGHSAQQQHRQGWLVAERKAHLGPDGHAGIVHNHLNRAAPQLLACACPGRRQTAPVLGANAAAVRQLCTLMLGTQQHRCAGLHRGAALQRLARRGGSMPAVGSGRQAAAPSHAAICRQHPAGPPLPCSSLDSALISNLARSPGFTGLGSRVTSATCGQEHTPREAERHPGLPAGAGARERAPGGRRRASGCTPRTLALNTVWPLEQSVHSARADRVATRSSSGKEDLHARKQRQ